MMLSDSTAHGHLEPESVIYQPEDLLRRKPEFSLQSMQLTLPGLDGNRWEFVNQEESLTRPHSSRQTFQLDVVEEPILLEAEQHLGLVRIERTLALPTAPRVTLSLPAQPSGSVSLRNVLVLEFDRRRKPGRIVHRWINRDEDPCLRMHPEKQSDFVVGTRDV